MDGELNITANEVSDIKIACYRKTSCVLLQNHSEQFLTTSLGHDLKRKVCIISIRNYLKYVTGLYTSLKINEEKQWTSHRSLGTPKIKRNDQFEDFIISCGDGDKNRDSNRSLEMIGIEGSRANSGDIL